MSPRPTTSRRALFAVAALVLAAPLAAQQHPPEVQVPAGATSTGPDPKVATVISGGTPLLGLAVLMRTTPADAPVIAASGVAMILFGPSMGFVYSGRPGRALKSSLFRLGAAGVLGGGIAMLLEGNDNHGGDILAFAGLLALTGSIVYDVWTVGDAAREERELRLQVAPGSDGVDLSVRIPF